MRRCASPRLPSSACRPFSSTPRPPRLRIAPTSQQSRSLASALPPPTRCLALMQYRGAPYRRYTEQAKPPANEPTGTTSTNPAAPKPPLWRRILTRIESDSPYPPYTKAWWTDKAVVFGVFGVTGSSTMFFVRPLLTDVLHIQTGTWTYVLASLLLISPSYTVLLVLFGTLAGRREYFTKIAKRMWGRFLPFLREKKDDTTSPPPAQKP